MASAPTSAPKDPLMNHVDDLLGSCRLKVARAHVRPMPQWFRKAAEFHERCRHSVCWPGSRGGVHFQSRQSPCAGVGLVGRGWTVECKRVFDAAVSVYDYAAHMRLTYEANPAEFMLLLCTHWNVWKTCSGTWRRRLWRGDSSWFPAPDTLPRPSKR